MKDFIEEKERELVWFLGFSIGAKLFLNQIVNEDEECQNFTYYTKDRHFLLDTEKLSKWFSQSLQSAYEKGVADGANIDKNGFTAHLLEKILEQQKKIDGE